MTTRLTRTQATAFAMLTDAVQAAPKQYLRNWLTDILPDHMSA